MNKELEALKRIKYKLSNSKANGYWEDLDIIETALKNYQELIEKPCVLVGKTNEHTKTLIDTICKNFKAIKITNLEDEKKLKEDEKKLKAFEIIKKKRVNVEWLLNTENVEEYNESLYNDLTQEQFNLLKDWLKNG